MGLQSSELASISDQLEDLVERIGNVLKAADEEDEDFNNLSEVERQLTATTRRLVKFVNRI